jgi:menaquinone-specific isochorismate synthase
MKFIREQIPTQDVDSLRALGARDGWLIENTDQIRIGFGEIADRIDLSGGLEPDVAATDSLRSHELQGVDGPPGTGVVAFGSLPFDRSAPGHLDIPEYSITQNNSGEAWLSRLDDSTDWNAHIAAVAAPTQETQSLRSISFLPTPEEYAHNVALAVEILRRKEIVKVVLARSVNGTVPEPLDPAAIIARLKKREPICTLYSLPTEDGRRFVGASPELLLRRTGANVVCHPLAGTIALPPNVQPDDYQNWLLGSSKNLHEHEVPVNEIVTALATVFENVHADPTPSIVTLRTLAHLGTWITASVEHEVDSPDALEVLRILHPTAAVGGIPRKESYELLQRLEQHDRGHYAGPVGWVDARGDGEWWIGIRGILLHEANFEAWAGAGIVSESDPIAEREETRAKLASVLSSVLVDSVQ